MSRVNKQMVLGLAGLSAMLVACRGEPIYAPAARVDPTIHQGYPAVTVEPALQKFVVVAEPVVQGEDVKTVTVPVRLINKHNYPINIQYKFTFTDKDGAPLRTQPGWKYIVLEPGMRRDLTGTALDNTAENWQLEIRSARGAG